MKYDQYQRGIASTLDQASRLASGGAFAEAEQWAERALRTLKAVNHHQLLTEQMGQASEELSRANGAMVGEGQGQ